MRVLLAGGGTAGHTSPLLATADALRRLDATTSRSPRSAPPAGIEGRVVPERGLPAGADPAGPAAAPAQRRPACRCRPGSGGAVQGRARGRRPGPARRRGRLRRLRLACRPTSPPGAGKLPIVVHEGNALPGIANKLGARFTPHVATQLPGHAAAARDVRRPADPADDLHARPGGAARRGAARSSGSTPTCRPCWSPAARRAPAGSTSPCRRGRAGARRRRASRCCTSSGPKGEASRDRATAGEPPYVVLPYVDRMDLAYAAADLVVCRAGANTVTEVAAVGLPAVFVPLPIGNGEQELNARPVVDAGGGLLVAGRRADARVGRPRTVPALAADPARLAAMSRRGLGPDPARRRRAAGADRARARRERADDEGPGPRRAAARRPARPRALRRHRRRRAVRHRPDHAGPRHDRQRQRRQGVPHPRGAARARGALLRRPRRRPGPATSTPLVVSTAVREPTTPRSSRPSGCGLRLLPRSAALESVMRGRRVVAVAGTHGKTTTTSLLTVALQHCGADPSFAIGGELNESGSNAARRHAARSSSPRPTRATAPSSSTRPYGALVTNVEADHLDNYGTEEAYHEAFVAVPRPDRPRRLPGRLRRRRRRRRPRRAGARDRGSAVVGVGESADADAPRRGPARSSGPRRASRVVDRGRRLGEVTLQIPGRHYVLDALAALAAGLRLGFALRRPAPRARGVQRHPPPDGAQGRGRRGPGLRQLRPPPQRDRRRPAGGPLAGRRGPGGGRVPAAPGLAHQDLRRRRWARRSAPPTRSSSWTSTSPARTPSPGSTARWSPRRPAARRARALRAVVVARPGAPRRRARPGRPGAHPRRRRRDAGRPRGARAARAERRVDEPVHPRRDAHGGRRRRREQHGPARAASAFARRQWARRWLAWRRVVVAVVLLVAWSPAAGWLVFFSSVLAVSGVAGRRDAAARPGRRAPGGRRCRRAPRSPRVDLDAIRARVEALPAVQTRRRLPVLAAPRPHRRHRAHRRRGRRARRRAARRRRDGRAVPAATRPGRAACR